MTPEQLTEARKIAAISAPGSGIALLVAHIDAQAAEIGRIRSALVVCKSALAEELAAWDIDPPLQHIKHAHDLCAESLKEAK